MCPLTAGSLRGVPVLPLTAGQTTTENKKKQKLPAVCFLILQFKSLLILAFLYYCSRTLTRLNSVVSGNTSARPAPVALQRSSLKCLKSAFVCNEPSVSYFTFLLTKLLQLLSQSRRITHTWCVAELLGLTWGAVGVHWPRVYTIHLRPLHSYHEFTAEGQDWWWWMNIWPCIYSVVTYAVLEAVPRTVLHCWTVATTVHYITFRHLQIT